MSADVFGILVSPDPDEPLASNGEDVFFDGSPEEMCRLIGCDSMKCVPLRLLNETVYVYYDKWGRANGKPPVAITSTVVIHGNGLILQGSSAELSQSLSESAVNEISLMLTDYWSSADELEKSYY